MKPSSNISKQRYFIRPVIYLLLGFVILNTSLSVVLADANPPAGTLPSGVLSVPHGSVGNFDYSTAGRLDIRDVSHQTVINWNNFDIGTGATTQFHQLGVNPAVMNRIHDGSPTGIHGSLLGNGRVFIINPAGVIFGPGSTINVNQLVASSLNMTNEDFINSTVVVNPLDMKFELLGDGVVENHGVITAADSVYLVGKNVLNAGTIISPGGLVVMAAGEEVWLAQPGSNVIVKKMAAPSQQDHTVVNSGTIEAAGGEIVLAAGDIFSNAIDDLDTLAVVVGRVGQFGTLSVDATDGDGGSITMTAGEVVVLGSESLTTANAGTNGDGGEVVAYSPGMVLFNDGAQVEAKGGSESGDGGFLELSGKEYVEIEGWIDLTASNGENGEFLIDPRNIKIVNGSVNQGNKSGSIWKPKKWKLNQHSKLGIDRLNNYLSNGNVILETGFPGLQSGWVIFNASKDVSTGIGNTNSLTVNAENYIRFNANCGINFEGSGNVTLNAKRDVTINAEITLNGGYLEILGGQSLLFGNDIHINENITAGSMRIKNGRDAFPGEAGFSAIHLANDKSLESTTGNVVIEAVHDVVLGGDVLAAGDIFINGDEDGYGNPLTGSYHPISFGGGDVIARNLTAGGNIEVKGNAIQLNGDVSANGGNLAITGRTSRELIFGTLLDTGNPWGNIDVATGKSLYASGNVNIDDLSNPGGKPLMTLTGHSSLVIEAENGVISAPDTVIQVLGSSLTLEQGLSLNIDDFLFANQSNTDLTLISNNGSVTSVETGTKPENAADQWLSIGATANTDITFSGNSGNIMLGDSGKDTTKSLWAKTGNIDVTSVNNNIEAAKDLTSGGDMTLQADVDVIAHGNLNAGGNISINASADTIYLGGNVGTINGDVTFGENVIADGIGNQRFEAKGNGKVLHAEGTITKTTGGDLTLAGGYYAGGGTYDSGYEIDLDGDVTVKDGSLILGDWFSFADDDVTVAAGRTLKASKDVTAYDDLYGEGDLFVWAGDDVSLCEDVTAEGKIVLGADTAEWDGKVYVGGDISANGGDMEITGADIEIKGDAYANGNIEMEARETGYQWFDLGDVSVDGDIDSTDGVQIFADDHITLGQSWNNKGNVGTGGDVKLIGGNDGDSYGDVEVYGDIDAGGSVEIDAVYDTIYLHGDVFADDYIWLMANTEFEGWFDQYLDAGTWIQADGYLNKLNSWGMWWSDGSLYLHAYGDISLADDVAAAICCPEMCWSAGGGVSIISDTGMIYTPGFYEDVEGVEKPALAIDITGRSDQFGFWGPIGVDLPYDDGKAAIVLQSAEDLVLHEWSGLRACGTYYAESVDDRVGVGFLADPGVSIGGEVRDEGVPIDVAVYVASTGTDTAAGQGNIHLGGEVDIMSREWVPCDGDGLEMTVIGGGKGEWQCINRGDMIADAYDTITFGTKFEGALADGRVGDRLEVCSRITEWLGDADGRLPFPDDLTLPEGYNYVMRGAGLENGSITDGRAWVLEYRADLPPAPLGGLLLLGTEEVGFGEAGCPALLTWMADELGVDEEGLQVYLSNAFVYSTDCQPCELAATLRDLSVVLEDPESIGIAAIAQVISEFITSPAPPSEEEMALIAEQLASHAGDGTYYAAAGQWIDTLVAYVGVLVNEMGWSVDDAVAFVMDKYGARITDTGNPALIAYVEARLAALGG